MKTITRWFARRSVSPQAKNDTRALPQRPIKITWCGDTDAGKIKRLNEDSILCMACDGRGHEEHPLEGSVLLSESDFVCAVSDGMGGANAGDRASNFVIQKMLGAIPRAFLAGARGLRPDYGGYLEEILHGAHRELNAAAEADPEHRGMGATLSLCWFGPKKVWFAHVGDSRIYRFRNGRLIQITHDHSRVGHLFRTGLINERQARTHPRRNVLQQALGGGIDRIIPQLGSLELRPGDWFLICSDGLTEGLWNRNLQEGFSGAKPTEEGMKELCDGWLERSLSESGRDNTSLVIARVSEVGR